MFDSIKLSKKTEEIVCKNSEKLYARFRSAKFYGGISTCDACGCNLRCIFCWAWRFVTQPKKYGKFYSPSQVAKKLVEIAKRHNFSQLRITGAEPTIGKRHLIEVLKLIPKNYLFILETNGVLIGYDDSYSKDLAKFKNLHVRVSIKAATAESFAKITGASPEAFEFQLKALENLVRAGVRCHPAVMVSFSTNKELQNLRERLKKISLGFGNFEEEELIRYSHVMQRLKTADMRPQSNKEP